MSPSLTTATWVSALVRRVNAAGGFATIIAKGDPGAGSVLLVLRQKSGASSLHGRVISANGVTIWDSLAKDDDSRGDQIDQYLARQRKYDPDLWVVELDIANPERFIDDPLDSA